MNYKDIRGETRLDRLLATPVGNLGIYFRKLLGLSRVPESKYNVELPPTLDTKSIQAIAYAIRGSDHKPAIFIHGVLPRSGTNYLADLLEQHPDIYAHPHQFWEFPLLSIADRIEELQADFARVYRRNAEVLMPLEFAACLSSGLMRYLQEQVGHDKTMMFKFPFVHHIALFRALFPRGYLILLLRDGRDVVASSMKSFGGGLFPKRFSDFCVEWDYATNIILKHVANGPLSHPRTLVVRYEEIFSDPQKHIREILKKVELDPRRYDYGKIEDMPVRGSSDLAEENDGINWKGVARSKRFNPIGRWKDWPQHRKRKFKTIAGKTLIAAGYETGDDW